MPFLIRNADGDELEVEEHMFVDQYQHQGYERVSAAEYLGKLTRDQLNTHAENLGIDDPAHYATKAELIEAIEQQATNSVQAVEDQHAQDEEATRDAAPDDAGAEEAAANDADVTEEETGEADANNASSSYDANDAGTAR